MNVSCRAATRLRAGDGRDERVQAVARPTATMTAAMRDEDDEAQVGRGDAGAQEAPAVVAGARRPAGLPVGRRRARALSGSRPSSLKISATMPVSGSKNFGA